MNLILAYPETDKRTNQFSKFYANRELTSVLDKKNLLF